MRVALYARVSSEEQVRHGISIDAQVAALQEWAKDYTVVDTYKDLGVSGRKPYTKRPEMMRLLDDVEAGKIDLIAFCKLDRWFRSVAEYYRVQDILDRHKVAWRAIQEDYETETSSGRFKVNIMLSVAQSEAEKTGERIKAVNAYKSAKGEFLCGNAPLGTKLENKILVPDDNAWKVREMFNVFLSTGSVYGSIPILAERGIKIGNRSLRYVLENENYLRVGIITPEEWRRAEELRGEKRPKAVNTRTYLFTGLVYCPECGNRLSGMHSKNTYYYRCPRFYQDRSCRMSSCIPEQTIETFFLKTLQKKMNETNIRLLSAKPVDTAPLKRKLDKLADMYLADMISKEKYEREYKATKAALAEAEAVKKPIDTEQVISTMTAYGTLSREAKRAFWYRIIKKATVSKDGIDYTLSYT